MGCQKVIAQEWLSILIWNFREMINWPKRQYLYVTTIATTAASTTTTTTTTTTITKTTTSVAGTTKAEDIEINIWGNIDGKRWIKSKHIMCIHIDNTNVLQLLKRIIVSRGNFRGIMSGIFSWPKGKMNLLLLLLILLLLLLLLLLIIYYYCYCCSYYYQLWYYKNYYYDTSTIKAKRWNWKINRILRGGGWTKYKYTMCKRAYLKNGFGYYVWTFREYLKGKITKKYKIETIGKIFLRQWKSVLWIFWPYVQGPSSAQYENKRENMYI